MRLPRIVRTVATVSAVAGHDWLVWGGARTVMYNDAMPRGYRPAEPYEHNLDPLFTPIQMHIYRPCENYPPTFSRLEILSDAV